MNKTVSPTSRADLADAELIAEASSETPEKDAWTVLSIWYRRGHNRPFVTVIEGLVRNPDWRHLRFRAICTGTLGRALDVLDTSDLQTHLASMIPADAYERYPDTNALRMLEAEERRAKRGYTGKVALSAALAWLYPDLADGSDNAIATKFETDFGIGARTTRKIIADERSGGEPPTWVEAFVAAMRFFDRKAWEHRDV